MVDGELLGLGDGAGWGAAGGVVEDDAEADVDAVCCGFRGSRKGLWDDIDNVEEENKAFAARARHKPSWAPPPANASGHGRASADAVSLSSE